jgi:shikimate dehydrogenase
MAIAPPGTLPSRLVLVGWPVRHSLSPTFQNAALRAAGIPLRYDALAVEPSALPAMLAALTREGAAGNVTIPHKEAAWRCCATRTPVAERTGAVNTFWTRDGALHGDNTDVEGFAALAGSVLGPVSPGLRVLVLGAGGAAAAVLAAVESWPERAVTVVGRSPERAARLAARWGSWCTAADDAAQAARDATVVVNATPIGLHDDAMPLPVAQLRRDAAVLDLVYRPGGTAWVAAARAAGHPSGDGLPMLVEQGALAFRRWLGVEPDRATMWRSLGALGER